MHKDPSIGSTGEPGRADTLQTRGDGDLIADLYTKHYGALLWYAVTVMRSEDEAAEIVQDVFAHAAAERSVLQRQRNPVAFLYRAVRNQALNRLRDERVLRRETELYATDVRNAHRVATNDGESALMAQEIESWSRVLVERLPTKQREVFQLVRLGGLSYMAAARLLGVQFSTVNTHLVRATQAVAAEMERLGLLDGAIRPLLRSTGTRSQRRKKRVPNRRSGRVI